MLSVSQSEAKPARILCVDDSPEVSALLKATFERAGYDVETAQDGQDALSHLSAGEQPFDLIITDTRMPNVSGPDLVESARAAGFRGSVIVFSASMTDQDRERYAALNVDGIVAKPNLGELMTLVRQLMDRDSRDRATRSSEKQ